MGLPDGEDNERVIKYICADVDKCGKDARGAADAIKKSIEAFECAGLVGGRRSRKNISVLTPEGGVFKISNPS